MEIAEIILVLILVTSGAKKTPEGERKGGWRKKHARGARTQDLPHARRGSPAARHGGCLDKQAFPCL